MKNSTNQMENTMKCMSTKLNQAEGLAGKEAMLIGHYVEVTKEKK